MPTLSLCFPRGRVKNRKGNMIKKEDFISIEEKIQKRIIEDRNQEYGDYQENFALLAELFSIVLFNKIKVALEPEDVGHIMMALKLYRCTKKYKADSYDDLAIYCKMTKQLRQKKK
jgi:hypothetical protein